MKILTLNLKKEYFEAIKSGEKLEEYRLYKDHWRCRLNNKSYDLIRIACGFPKSGHKERIIYRKWNGYKVKMVTHKHFGDKPVKAYVIDVSREVPHD